MSFEFSCKVFKKGINSLVWRCHTCCSLGLTSSAHERGRERERQADSLSSLSLSPHVFMNLWACISAPVWKDGRWDSIGVLPELCFPDSHTLLNVSQLQCLPASSRCGPISSSDIPQQHNRHCTRCLLSFFSPSHAQPNYIYPHIYTHHIVQYAQ